MKRAAGAMAKASRVAAAILAMATMSAALQREVPAAFGPKRSGTVVATAASQSLDGAELPKEIVRRILVSLPDRKLALFENGKLVRVYSVAVGKPSTPSPTGTFTIVSRVANPTYYHKGEVIAAGKGNPVGTRWMGLSAKGYGIHGTNQPKSIGKAASTGCIRVGKRDLEELFRMVEVGDTVEIRSQRDAEIARVFGTGANGVSLAENTAETGAAGGQ